MIYGYARVSTSGQKLDVQLEQLRAAGCQVIYQEKASGADKERPELQRLLRYVVRGDVVIVCKLDRIARSTQHLLAIVEQLENKGVAFRALNTVIDTSTPTGKLMLTILAAVATFEREIMLERQREGISRAKSEGKYRGRDPVAKSQSSTVLGLLDGGLSVAATATMCGISVPSVYRIKRAARVGRTVAAG